jgi:beta-glucanase (GH16 family)
MPRLVVVVASLVAALIVSAEPVALADDRAGPAVAQGKAAGERPVTMAKPESARRGLVLLQGRVSGSSGRVVLQRSADGRWVKVRLVPVRRHAYQVVVPTRPKLQRFRVRAGKETSQIRIVPASHPTKTQDACGKRPRKPDGSRWSCTFADDFDATKLDRSRWLPHTNFVSGPGNGNRACYRDHPDNVSVARGTLRLTVRRLSAPVTCARPNVSSEYVSGMVSTYRRFSQRYGLFEARFKVTATREPGLQEAFWMWPDDRQDIPVLWPAAGEIDVVETYSGNPDLAIPFLHYTFYDNGGPRPGVNTAWDCKAKRGVFNTYTLEWSAERIEISVNGDSCLVNTSGNSAFQRRYILALTQALGIGRNQYVGKAPIPATMTVDYVRVWR